MDLNTVQEVLRPRGRAELPEFAAGDAYLAGGTWLFSEPQTGLRRLVDLTALRWPALERTADGLVIGATCTLAELEAFEAPAAWLAAETIGRCCRALLGSFKIRKHATVGGNLCLALPASPMAALVAALDGVCTIWGRDGAQRELPAIELITGAGDTCLAPGEVLRSVTLPEASLRRRCALRQASLTTLGRSAALLIGTRDPHFALTVTGSVARPVRLRDAAPEAIDAAIPQWYDDVHGAPGWRRRVTHLLAAEICAELA